MQVVAREEENKKVGNAAMHVVINTKEIRKLLNKVRPLKILTASGYDFVVYDLYAYDNQLQILTSDGSSISLLCEAKAKVVAPGKISLNGNDFFQIITKLVPESEWGGSKELVMQVAGSRLLIETVTTYQNTQSVKQERSLSLVKTQQHYKNSMELESLPIELTLDGNQLLNILNLLIKVIVNYTADLTSLAGILLRARDNQLTFVASDGYRIVELQYPEVIASPDFELLLPKNVCVILQTLISPDVPVVCMSDKIRIKFIIQAANNTVQLNAALLRGFLPSYGKLFERTGLQLSISNDLLLDNISNVRRVVSDQTYRVKLAYANNQFTITNHTDSHVNFKNAGIPVISGPRNPFSVILNALLLESTLALFGDTDLVMTVPGDDDPVIFTGKVGELEVKGALAVAGQ